MAQAADIRTSRACLAVLAGVLLATWLLYRPALPGPLLLDDYVVIAPLMAPEIFSVAWRDLLFTDTGPLGRPLAQASFLLNAYFAADDLSAWKAVNLAIHMLNGGLLCVLFNALATAAGMRGGRAAVLALCASAIWLVHPLLVSSVMYTVQRMTLLATSFSAFGMLLYVRGRTLGPARGRGQVLAAFLLCTPLAALAKETGLLLPYLLAAVELTVFASSRWPRPAWLKITFLSCAGLPALLAVGWLVAEPSRYLLRAYTIRDFTPFERVLTEFRVLLDYLTWIAVPDIRALGFFHDDIRISRSPAEVDVMVAFAVLAALAGAAWRWRRRAPLAALGVAVFFVGHALESSVFGLELAFEHRNYLPAAGIVLALASLAQAALPARAAVAIAVVVFTLFGGVTALRSITWGDAGRLYQHAVAANPGSGRARLLLAEWFVAHGAYAEALAVQDGVPGPLAALYRLRVACARDGRPGEPPDPILAAAAAETVLDEVSSKSFVWLAGAAERRRCALPGAALLAALDQLAARPGPAITRYQFAVAAARLRYSQGAQDEARERLLGAAALHPQDPFPWYLAAEWAIAAGARDDAVRLLGEAQRRDRTRRFHAVDAALRDTLGP